MPAGGKGGTLVLKMETRSGSDRQPQKGSVRRLALIPSLLWVLYRPCQLGSLPNMEVAPIRHKDYITSEPSGETRRSHQLSQDRGDMMPDLQPVQPAQNPCRSLSPKLRLHKQLASHREFHRAQDVPPAIGRHPRCCTSWPSSQWTSLFTGTFPQAADRRVAPVKSRGHPTAAMASRKPVIGHLRSDALLHCVLGRLLVRGRNRLETRIGWAEQPRRLALSARYLSPVI